MLRDKVRKEARAFDGVDVLLEERIRETSKLSVSPDMVSASHSSLMGANFLSAVTP